MSFKLDKAQRVDLLQYLEDGIDILGIPEMTFVSTKNDLPRLKSLKAMVESFDTTGKQVEDSGDVRHKQKTVTKEWVRKKAEDFRYSRQQFATEFLTESIELLLKELGIKVTDKEG